jgi:hypothetical protein
MTIWAWLSDAGISIIPPVIVGLIFWLLMRSILKADSVERREYKKIEAEERAKAAAVVSRESETDSPLK